MARSHGSSRSLLEMITSGRIDKLLESIDGVKVIPNTGIPTKDDPTERELKTYLKRNDFGQEEIAYLSEWWPNSGPKWDYVCKAKLNGDDGLILLEAKSHKSETKKAKKPEPDPKMVINLTQATANHQRIEANIDAEFNRLGGEYNGYYQIANRVAFANKAYSVLKMPVLLVFLGFAGDKHFGDKLDNWEIDMKAHLTSLKLGHLLEVEMKDIKNKIGIRVISTALLED